MAETLRVPLGGEFEFRIKRYEASWLPDNPDSWVVDLPHQCDEWEIVDAEDHAVALARLELFIAEAQAALAKLRELAP